MHDSNKLIISSNNYQDLLDAAINVTDCWWIATGTQVLNALKTVNIQ